jgi:hypothetical protein
MKEAPPVWRRLFDLYFGSEEGVTEKFCGLFFTQGFFEYVGGGTAMSQQTFYVDGCFLPFDFRIAGRGGFGSVQECDHVLVCSIVKEGGLDLLAFYKKLN